MEIASLLIGLIIVAVAAYLVGAPLLLPEKAELLPDEPDEEETLEREKESVFGTLAEIEFDYQMHKLDETDYQALKNKYRQQAVHVLEREENELGAPSPVQEREEKLDSALAREIDAEIERELERLRKEKGK